MKTIFVVGVLLSLSSLALGEDINFNFGLEPDSESPKNELAVEEAEGSGSEVIISGKAASGETEAGSEVIISGKAASRQVNCRCQCSSITFLDKYGQLNGNCHSADSTGALWCYVDPLNAQCPDLQRSVRFQSLWSYTACATPDLTSQQCGGYVPAVGNGVGAGAIPTGVAGLLPGPEGYPFIGGYPGLNGGTGLPLTGSGTGFPTGSGLPTGAGYPLSGSGSGFPAAGSGSPTGAGYPSISGILDIPRKNTVKEEESGFFFSQ
jgi:hypothetical protein